MTKELVLISHGKMAEEVKKSAELIMGPQEHIHVVKKILKRSFKLPLTAFLKKI